VRIFAAAKTLIFLGSVLHNYRQRDKRRSFRRLCAWLRRRLRAGARLVCCSL